MANHSSITIRNISVTIYIYIYIYIYQVYNNEKLKLVTFGNISKLIVKIKILIIHNASVGGFGWWSQLSREWATARSGRGDGA